MPGKPKPDPLKTSDELTPDLRYHLIALNLSSTDEYKEWCLKNGFHTRLEKSWPQRNRERQFKLEQDADDHLRRTKQDLGSRQDLLRAICRGDLRKPVGAEKLLNRLCSLLNEPRKGKGRRQPERKSLLHLLTCLGRQRTKLFCDDPVIGEFGHQDGNSYVEALLMFAAYRDDWLRPIEQWKPRSHNAWRQFSSLARHLFVKHDDMPEFFHKAWFAGPGKQADTHRGWYLHVGRGSNIRHCELPIRFTKKMSHYFMRAPEELTVKQALRWAQVHGLEGDDRLSRAIFGTRLSERFENEEFWETVISWFVEHSMFDRTQVGPTIDYLHHQRFVPAMVHVGAEENEYASPAQPNLTMKGRCPEKLLAAVTKWHGDLTQLNIRQIKTWDGLDVEGFDYLEGSEQAGSLRRWTIHQLRSNKELATEGKKLKHCVATYASSCASGYSSIWTMHVDDFEGRQKLLTIEVRNESRTVCQVRGKRNRLATKQEMDIVRLWAHQKGLNVASYLRSEN